MMNRKHKSLPLLIAVLLTMLLAAFSVNAFASDSDVSVDITAQQSGAFLFAPKFSESVSADLAESYGYTDNVKGGVSALDVLVRAHEIAFGTDFTAETRADYLSVTESGSIEKMFGTQTITVGFAINGGFPNDGNKSNGSYTGTAVNESPVKNNDVVEFFFYQDEELYLDNIVWFCQDGSAVSEITAKPGEQISLALKGVSYVYSASNYENGAAMHEQGGTAVCGQQLAWVNAADGSVEPIDGCITDSDDGTFTLTMPSEGTYYLTATGTDDSDSPAIMSLTKVVSDPNYGPPTVVSCDLASLTVASLIGDEKQLTPAFASDVTEYSVPEQEYSTSALDTSFKVQFQKKDDTASVEVKHNGAVISEGGGGWYTVNGGNALKPGVQNKLTITVTASDDSTKTYTVTIPMKEPEPEMIEVTFTLLGDAAHGAPAGKDDTHTLTGGNLTPWLARASYTVADGSTVGQLFEKALAAAGLTYTTNAEYKYIESITREGVTLNAATNGSKCGWMYALNDRYANLGMYDQTLAAGDDIVVYFTDDYSAENFNIYCLGLVMDYVKTAVPSPKVGSSFGEWAVLAMARNGSISEDAKSAYLANLAAYAENCDGKLDSTPRQSKHTEYSRVVVAMTSIGQDASAFTVGDKTYDFITPLLDDEYKQVKVQGNNGPIWALIALNSGSYLADTDTGKAARATWIADICAAQGEQGDISTNSKFPDVAMTGMAIEALAPYYLDEAKLTALGGTITYAELKAVVDKALAYLSAQQNAATGSCGDTGKDAEVIVALCSLGIDPATFTRGEGWDAKSILDGLFTCYMPAENAFKLTSTAKKVNQMATEQAAYALTAYKRFLDKENTLYDMSDVFPAQAEGFTIMATAGEGGSISPAGEVSCREGADQTFTVTPADNYKIKDVLVDGKSVGAVTTYTFENIAAAHTIAAEFSKKTTGGGGSGSSSSNEITVYFTLLGDSVHEVSDTNKHTMSKNNLKTWLSRKAYKVEKDATVMDLIEKALTEAGISWKNSSGNYIESVTYKDITIGEMDNGANSGWKYTLNGKYPELGVDEQTLKKGDAVILHYTDDYTIEKDAEKWSGGGSGGSSNTATESKDDQKPNTENNTADKAAFADVKDSDWYSGAVKFVCESGLMNGEDEAHFNPSISLNRAMLVTILYRLDKQPKITEKAQFVDVAAGQWYTDAVAWAKLNGIVKGYEDNSFAPMANITREETAAILMRYAEFKGLDTKTTRDLGAYGDAAKVSAWAKDSMAWANAVGLIQGDQGNILNPAGETNRAEAAVIMMRMLQNVIK